MRELYPFQKTAVRFHLENPYSLNCSPMGLGKSLMALASAKATGLPTIVFGPVFLERTWKREAEAENLDITYMAYTQMHKQKLDFYRQFRFWICDEVHMLKNHTAKRTQQFNGLLRACLPDYWIGLTGTPVKNRVYDLWTLLMLCDVKPGKSPALPPKMRNYYTFCRNFCVTHTLNINGRKVEKYGGLKPDKTAELRSYLKHKMVRFRVEDVLLDLPDMTRKPVLLDLEPQPELLEDFKLYLEGKKIDSQAKRLSATLKAPKTIDYCKTLLEEEAGPLVVFSDHVDSAEYIARGLGVPAITGEVLADKRAEIVDKFQAGSYPAIVATIGALSVGVTLTASRHVIFNDLSWVPANNEQAEKRIHRIGQKSACLAHYIDATPTDEYIRRTLQSKTHDSAQVLR